MKSDGSVVRCSREENKELFSLVLGGYGLFGIILEADLRTVPNRAYKLDRKVLLSEMPYLTTMSTSETIGKSTWPTLA